MGKEKPLIALVTNNDDDVYCFRLELIKKMIDSGYEMLISCPHGPKFELMNSIPYRYDDSIIDRRGTNVVADRYGVYSNLLHVFWTNTLKQYKYPIIQNEKFIGESYLYEKMNVLYYIERKPLYYAKYREDGLTAEYLKLHVKNPKGYKLLKEQVMQLDIPLYHRFRGAIMYVAACILCDDKNIVKNSKCKILTLVAFPFGWYAYHKKYRNIKNINNTRKYGRIE